MRYDVLLRGRAVRYDVLLRGRAVTREAMVTALCEVVASREALPVRDEYVGRRVRAMLDGRTAPEFDVAEAIPREFAYRIAGWLRFRGVEVEVRRHRAAA